MKNCFKCLSIMVILIVVIVITNCKKVSDTLTYEGSSTIGEGIMPDATKQFEKITGIKFTSIKNSGSGTGFKVAMEGNSDIGGLSRSLKNKEKAENPYYQIIGYDAIGIYVHRDNPIASLTKEQIKAIFTGEITNWQEVGGNNRPIEVVTEIVGSKRATIEVFKKVALDGVDFCKTLEIDRPSDCVKYVGEHQNAITHASLCFIDDNTRVTSVNEIAPSVENIRSGSYILSRSLILVSKSLPVGNTKKFFDFIFSKEGQTIVNKKFISVR